MKVIPEKDQYWRQCYFCGTYRNPNNPVAFELENCPALSTFNVKRYSVFPVIARTPTFFDFSSAERAGF